MVLLRRHTAVPGFDFLGFLTYRFSAHMTGTVVECRALLKKAATEAAASMSRFGVELSLIHISEPTRPY